MQIGGSAQTARAQVMPGGIQTPFDFNMTVQLQNMVDDIENSLLLRHRPGAQSTATGVTAKMNGLQGDLARRTTSTTPDRTPSAYGSTDLIRDTLQAARSGGGEPDLLVVSTNFMSGFATWGQAIQRVPAGETVFGTPINVLEAPFLHGVTIVEAPLLRPYTAIALTSSARSTSATSGTRTGTSAATAATWSRATGSPRWRSRSSTRAITPGSKASRPSRRTKLKPYPCRPPVGG